MEVTDKMVEAARRVLARQYDHHDGINIDPEWRELIRKAIQAAIKSAGATRKR